MTLLWSWTSLDPRRACPSSSRALINPTIMDGSEKIRQRWLPMLQCAGEYPLLQRALTPGISKGTLQGYPRLREAVEQNLNQLAHKGVSGLLAE